MQCQRRLSRLVQEQLGLTGQRQVGPGGCQTAGDVDTQSTSSTGDEGGLSLEVDFERHIKLSEDCCRSETSQRKRFQSRLYGFFHQDAIDEVTQRPSRVQTLDTVGEHGRSR